MQYLINSLHIYGKINYNDILLLPFNIIFDRTFSNIIHCFCFIFIVIVSMYMPSIILAVGVCTASLDIFIYVLFYCFFVSGL